ncbi:ABC transporter ATP-binding protein [archaeon]|jgi:ABC-type polysaccharide/polyol phosphate transport system ATPase subunit|nr:ABC transporter ATP-binding protein [archaeon]
MKEDVRIKLKNVTKKFDLSLRDDKSALAKTIDFLFGKSKKNDFLVLEDISFNVKVGENVGIIGKNGSGKSTLLRAIAGVYKIESGSVKTRGDLVYLTGFGYGLQKKLTMKDNIFLSGSIMGLSQEDIKEKFDEIVDFTGLRKYLNTKLFKFSSGMQSRLAASIGLHCVSHKNPDILLVDEVIGGGADRFFQKKALKKMESLLRGGSSVVLVSHSLDAIQKYCDRVFWLDDGKIVQRGNPEKVVEAYLKSIQELSK